MKELENRMLIDSEWETLEHESEYEHQLEITLEYEKLGLPDMRPERDERREQKWKK